MIVAGTRPLHVLNFINDRTGYLAWLRREDGQAAPDPDGGRAAHVHQLLRVAEAFDNVNAFLDYIAIMDGALRAARGQRSKEAVVLSTIHRYKGLEANYVFGIGWNDGILPHALNPDPGEELRLAYVCLTRARRRFECSFVESAISVKGRLRARPSPFIEKAGIPFKDMQIRKVAP
jgi:superfamily I DNA/RNA helicase